MMPFFSQYSPAITEKPKTTKKDYALYIISTLVLAAGLQFYCATLAPALSVVNDNVRLAKEIRLEKYQGIKADSKNATAFFESVKTENELYEEERQIIERFRKGAPWVGIFFGLSLGIVCLCRQ
jgi:hypothetical protein